MCTILLKAEKNTKNKIRFIELADGNLNAPVIESTYVPKSTLKVLGFEDGKLLEISMRVVDPEEANHQEPVKKKSTRGRKKKTA